MIYNLTAKLYFNCIISVIGPIKVDFGSMYLSKIKIYYLN
jgi:hypothetical protein